MQENHPASFIHEDSSFMLQFKIKTRFSGARRFLIKMLPILESLDLRLKRTTKKKKNKASLFFSQEAVLQMQHSSLIKVQTKPVNMVLLYIPQV